MKPEEIQATRKCSRRDDCYGTQGRLQGNQGAFAHAGTRSVECNIRCLIAEKPPIEYPPVDYRLIIRRVEELQDTLECLLQEDPEKRERAQMSLALENVSHTADMLRRVMLL